MRSSRGLGGRGFLNATNYEHLPLFQRFFSLVTCHIMQTLTLYYCHVNKLSTSIMLGFCGSSPSIFGAPTSAIFQNTGDLSHDFPRRPRGLRRGLAQRVDLLCRSSEAVCGANHEAPALGP